MPRPDVSDERIPQILNAAAAKFAENSIDGASMAQIAKAANVSKATIYHYFDSKDALVEALVRRLFDEDNSEIDSILQTKASFTERITLYADNLVILLEQNKALYPIFAEFKTMTMRRPSIQNIIQDYFAGYIVTFQQLIEEGQTQGEVRPNIAPQEAAIALVAIIEGAILLAQNLEKPLNEVMTPSLHIIMNGLATE